MESGLCFPTAPAAAALPAHRALTWPPGRGQAHTEAHSQGCQAMWHHRAQTCGNRVSIWDRLPPTHPSVLSDIWKGFKDPVLSPQAKVALSVMHDPACAPRGLAKKALQQERTWPHSLPRSRRHWTKSQNGTVLTDVTTVPETLSPPAQHHGWPHAATLALPHPTLRLSEHKTRPNERPWGGGEGRTRESSRVRNKYK